MTQDMVLPGERSMALEKKVNSSAFGWNVLFYLKINYLKNYFIKIQTYGGSTTCFRLDNKSWKKSKRKSKYAWKQMKMKT